MPFLASIATESTPRSPYDAAVASIRVLPDALPAARARLTLTQAQQAARIGISKESLLNVEAGKNVATSTTVACLSWLAAN